MANIKIFALGGLGETGKYMYIVEVDEDIIVMECGINVPGQDLLGIDQVIPDMKYLFENKERVKAVVISSSNHDKMGALPELLKISDFPIYTSRFTSFVLKDLLMENGCNDKVDLINIVKSTDKVKIRTGLEISFVQMSYSVPESFGIAIHTNDGVVFYTGAYNFKPRFDCLYQTNYHLLSALYQKGVLCLLSESIGCTYPSNTEADYLLSHHLEEAFKVEERLIISAYSKDFSKIQQVVDFTIKYNRKLGIIGRKAQRILDIGIKEGYLNIPDEILLNLKFIDEKNKNYSKDMVVLVTGDKHEPYFMLQRIARQRDKLISLHKGDVVVLLTVPYAGVEKMAATTIDVLYRYGAKVIQLDRKVLRSDHASGDNTMQLYAMLQPKYIMPVMGEYRHLHAQKQIALQSNYFESNIIIASNGDVAIFENQILADDFEQVHTGEILVDGSVVGDVNEVVLKDREYLSEDGLIIVIANVDARKRKILNDVEIVSYGFISERESTKIYQEVKQLFKDTVNKHFTNKYIDWQVLKSEVKDGISHYLFKEIKRRTLVIPTIIDTQS